MATLNSLPNELLCMICNAVYPHSDDRNDEDFWDRRIRLAALFALTRVNRRLSSIAEPVLYDRGVKHHHPLALAWAAKCGHAGTLRKALAAGALPDQKIRLQLTRQLWKFAHDTRRAAMDWENQDPQYWPTWSGRLVREPFGDVEYLAEQLDPLRETPCPCGDWAREMSPTLIEFDVFAPAAHSPVVDPWSHYNGVGFEDGSAWNHAVAPSWDDPDAGTEGAERELPPGAFETGPYLLREQTGLHLAASEGHTHIVKMLLDHGARINSPSRWLCPCRSPRGLWQSLLNRTDPEEQLGLGDRSPLHAAICASRIETAKYLVSAGARLTEEVGDLFVGYGALHQAAAAGHADLIGHILDTRPEWSVDQHDSNGLTSFYHAYVNGRWDSTVPLLLARGANIDFRLLMRSAGDHFAATPLGEACRLGRFDDAMKLIDLGADVRAGIVNRPLDMQDELHDMAQPPPLEVPLLHVCCVDFGRDFFRYPRAESIWRQASAQAASRSKLIARLISQGISPDLKWDPGDGREETPLSVAVRHINVPAVEALLVAGASVDACDSRGRNALMIAVEEPNTHRRSAGGLDWGLWGFLPSPAMGLPLHWDYPNRWVIVRRLLDAGIRVNDQDADGNTILHLLFDGHRSAYGWMESRVEKRILRLLLAKGADPCLRNAAGLSALRAAVQNEFVDAVEMIAMKCRIDLVDALPMEEIDAIFEAMRPSCCSLEPGFHMPVGSFDSDDESLDEPASPAPAVSWRIFDALLDMDRSGRLPWNASFVCSKLLGAKDCKNDPSLELAEVFCLRGLENASFNTRDMRMMLGAAIKACRMNLARALLREMPTADIDTLDEKGQTLLSVALSTRGQLPDFIMQLVNAGANIHRRTAPSIKRGDVTTPLKGALVHSAAEFLIEDMLRKQPIRGNPEAVEHRYLHFAVTLPWRLGLTASSPSASWSETDRVIRALLAAGADTAQLDDKGNTPLSLLLGRLARNASMLWETCHWFKPLSKGVDINRKNNEGSSAAEYLNTLLVENRHTAVELVDEFMEFYKVKNGEMMIEWRK